MRHFEWFAYLAIYFWYRLTSSVVGLSGGRPFLMTQKTQKQTWMMMTLGCLLLIRIKQGQYLLTSHSQTLDYQYTFSAAQQHFYVPCKLKWRHTLINCLPTNERQNVGATWHLSFMGKFWRVSICKKTNKLGNRHKKVGEKACLLILLMSACLDKCLKNKFKFK